MSVLTATVVGVVVLSAAGAVPVLAAVGLRWVALPLSPLAGAVVSAIAATVYVWLGVSFVLWFAAAAAVAALVPIGSWTFRPTSRPWVRSDGGSHSGSTRRRIVGGAGFAVVTGASAWCLRGLRTPSVGFDARSMWLMRPGWFLQNHAQLLIDMKVQGFVLTQTAYPPLVSASTAVVWQVTGVHSVRLGVTTLAVLNICALAAAALAVVECGRNVADNMASAPGRSGAGATRPWVPELTGVVVAAALVFVAAGVCEPFLTNGYADPIWSLAMVGAIAFGLQAADDLSNRSAAALLILVAGLSKNEGLVTAAAVVVLVAIRSIGWAGLRAGWRRWAGPIALAAGELVVLAWWPLVMRAVGARGATTTITASTDLASRTTAVVHGMSPYLHVLVFALPLSVVGGLVLSPVRRRGRLGNDLWAWLGLAAGLTAVGAALVTGSGAIEPWIRTTVHRISEFPVLEAWWIIAIWAVVASAGLAGGPDVDADSDRTAKVATTPGEQATADRPLVDVAQ